MKEFDLTQYFMNFYFTATELMEKYNFVKYLGLEYRYATITVYNSKVKFFDKYFAMSAHYDNNVLIDIRLMPLQDMDLKEFLIDKLGDKFEYEDLVWRDNYHWNFSTFAIGLKTADITTELTKQNNCSYGEHIYLIYAKPYVVTYPDGSREIHYFPYKYTFNEEDGNTYERF